MYKYARHTTLDEQRGLMGRLSQPRSPSPHHRKDLASSRTQESASSFLKNVVLFVLSTRGTGARDVDQGILNPEEQSRLELKSRV